MDSKDLMEANYKIDLIIDYLKNHDGHEYKLYNHDPDVDKPDSDIIEYAEDVKNIINKHFNSTGISELSFWC